MANAQQHTFQLELTLPENFDLFEHIKDLKTQGFYFLSFLIDNKSLLAKPIKTKELAAKLNFHVSTIRRWLKKLVALKYIKKIIQAVTADKRTRDPLAKGKNTVVGKICMMENDLACDKKTDHTPASQAQASAAWAPDHSATQSDASCIKPSGVTVKHTQDPLENFLDNLTHFERVLLKLQIRKMGFEPDPDKTVVNQIKLLSATHPPLLSVVMEIYEGRQQASGLTPNAKDL